MSDEQQADGTDTRGASHGETRIALTRSYASIKADSITIKPTRSGLLGPAIQAALTLLGAWAIAAFINDLPLWLLMALLVFVIISGPTAVLGLVYNVAGSAFVMERRKGTCRWQQGFLGLGLGTRELVPFDRIARIEVGSDFEDELNSGDLQDVVRWDVRLVKDNARVLDVASITTARPLADEALERVNDLARALGEMCGKPAATAAIPSWALEDFADSHPPDADLEARDHDFPLDAGPSDATMDR
ncbi:MAG: hypothetical protein WD800_05950 [Dehalococcoidia bacterium]